MLSYSDLIHGYLIVFKLLNNNDNEYKQVELYKGGKEVQS